MPGHEVRRRVPRPGRRPGRWSRPSRASPAPTRSPFMEEICGGHTHTIYRHGLEHLLPANVDLVHGPGCPVCVIPMGRVDDAISLARSPA